jgi:hypothetical protein
MGARDAVAGAHVRTFSGPAEGGRQIGAAARYHPRP